VVVRIRRFLGSQGSRQKGLGIGRLLMGKEYVHRVSTYSCRGSWLLDSGIFGIEVWVSMYSYVKDNTYRFMCRS